MANGRKWSVPLPAAAMVAGLALAMSGCAGGGGVFGSSYTIAPDDACGAQRQTMKSFQDYFFSSMIQGAAIGAAGGGVGRLSHRRQRPVGR